MARKDSLAGVEGLEGLGEVLFEFTRVGAYVKVCALHPATLTEVTIVGSPSVGPHTLKRTAARKLAYVLNKRREKR